MEISPFTVYLWQQADSIIAASSSGYVFTAGFVCAISGIAFIASRPEFYLNDSSINEIRLLHSVLRRVFLISSSLLALAATISTLMPTSKTIAMMYAVPAIVNSKVVQEDLPEIYQMGVNSLKEQLAPKAKSANVEASK